MPAVLSTGSSLIDAARLLNAIGAQGRVFGDLRAGGHGHFVLAASKNYQAPGRIIALEAYGQSVNALRSRLSEYGHDRVELLHADLESSRGVPLLDEEVDVALLANVLQLFSAPVNALKETRRIVKMGGIVAVITPKTSSPFYALAKTRGIGEDTARCLLEDHGFVCERRFEAGPHHICLVFRKA